MKAQRRHDLKTNTLATTLVTLPSIWRKIAGRVILIGTLTLLAALFAFRLWTNSRDAKIRMRDEVETAREDIEKIRYGQFADVQDAYEKKAGGLADVIDNSKDPKLLAQAWIEKGDLNLVVSQT